MRESGKVTGYILKELEDFIKPGISTKEINDHVEKIITDNGMIPTFKGYAGYPAAVCASINEEVVHGIPSAERILQEGDIISIDIGSTHKGYVSDAARTYAVHGPRIAAGMVFAIEPMITMGTYKVATLNDGWTVVTLDRKPAAHYENTVVITEGEPELLTLYSEV